MSGVVVIGTQWGDEGKGKVVDLLTGEADLVVRFQGGNNAGHTLVVGGETYALHLVPSGILHKGKRSVVAPGVVVDPEVLLTEIRELKKRGVEVGPENLALSGKAHLILPYHNLLDEARENPPAVSGGDGRVRIGTTGRGIGPAYEDKASRQGLRLNDLLDLEVFRGKLESALLEKNCLLTGLYRKAPVKAEDLMAKARIWASELAPYVTDTFLLLLKAREAGKRILFEGAQGSQLDLDHGTYPYVTSSSTTSGGAATGSGVPFKELDRVLGLVKAYTTRVGEGPFPTELKDEAGDALREKGGEYGTTTGRPRRCGWLDMVVVRTARALSGVDGLAVTKLDVLRGLKELKIAVAYKTPAGRLEYLPQETRDLEGAVPEYRVFPGFSEDIGKARRLSDLPRNAREYLNAMEEEAGAPLALVSVGPERDETVILSKMFPA
ncbi:MAG: adenylosuccinate synthase [Deltaproteobacteria bacterium]|jgi:adenylosuccinate synthase|nr:adenylosuccinate synthase [Deltaproteobacteria bacterium]